MPLDRLVVARVVDCGTLAVKKVSEFDVRITAPIAVTIKLKTSRTSWLREKRPNSLTSPNGCRWRTLRSPSMRKRSEAALLPLPTKLGES